MRVNHVERGPCGVRERERDAWRERSQREREQHKISQLSVKVKGIVRSLRLEGERKGETNNKTQ